MNPSAPSPLVVEIAGPLTVAEAQAWRARLAAALETGVAVVVDLAGVTAADVFGLQLLHAAQRSAALRARPLELRPLPAAVLAACAAAAIDPTAIGARPSSS